MTITGVETSNVRNQLSRKIVDAVSSWPERHRLVFTAVHYEGAGIDAAARLAGIERFEARRVLDLCERRLRAALRDFRRDECLSDPSDSPALAEVR